MRITEKEIENVDWDYIKEVLGYPQKKQLKKEKKLRWLLLKIFLIITIPYGMYHLIVYFYPNFFFNVTMFLLIMVFALISLCADFITWIFK